MPPTPSISSISEKGTNEKGSDMITKRTDVRVPAGGSPMLRIPKTSPLTKMPTMSPPLDAIHPALRSTAVPRATSVAPGSKTAVRGFDDRASLQALSESLVSKAQRETDPTKKHRLLSFAKVLTDSIISAREAHISAETAQAAARSAQLSYDMTMKSVEMLQRLAASMNSRGH